MSFVRHLGMTIKYKSQKPGFWSTFFQYLVSGLEKSVSFG